MMFIKCYISCDGLFIKPFETNYDFKWTWLICTRTPTFAHKTIAVFTSWFMNQQEKKRWKKWSLNLLLNNKISQPRSAIAGGQYTHWGGWSFVTYSSAQGASLLLHPSSLWIQSVCSWCVRVCFTPFVNSSECIVTHSSLASILSEHFLYPSKVISGHYTVGESSSFLKPTGQFAMTLLKQLFHLLFPWVECLYSRIFC